MTNVNNNLTTLIWKELTDDEQQNALKRAPQTSSNELAVSVANIVNQVKAKGDSAVLEFCEKFDKVKLSQLKVSESEINHAEQQISAELKQAIKQAKTNIEIFHNAQKNVEFSLETMPEVECSLLTRPINSVGLYIPGGSAPLFSTVLMLAIPAKIAGCKQITLCSPPPIANEILYTAKLCGVNNIFACGGAQAVAAMAYGTETIPKVNKIFGPGNSFVTEAKRLVSQNIDGCAIDMQAGPSEILVIADDKANPDFVASDLLSQAEHGVDSQVILVCLSQDFANKVELAIANQLSELPRANICLGALSHSRIIIVDDIDKACQLSNLYAPEHLVVQVENAKSLLDQLDNAGSIFLGAYSPEAMGDYASGTNHVLPTYGLTKTSSSLGLADFSKRMTVQQLSPTGFKNLAQSVVLMAQAEKLDAHANAVKIRLNQLNQSA